MGIFISVVTLEDSKRSHHCLVLVCFGPLFSFLVTIHKPPRGVPWLPAGSETPIIRAQGIPHCSGSEHIVSYCSWAQCCCLFVSWSCSNCCLPAPLRAKNSCQSLGIGEAALRLAKWQQLLFDVLKCVFVLEDVDSFFWIHCRFCMWMFLLI